MIKLFTIRDGGRGGWQGPCPPQISLKKIILRWEKKSKNLKNIR
jgi:hypothetical protein